LHPNGISTQAESRRCQSGITNVYASDASQPVAHLSGLVAEHFGLVVLHSGLVAEHFGFVGLHTRLIPYHTALVGSRSTPVYDPKVE